MDFQFSENNGNFKGFIYFYFCVCVCVWLRGGGVVRFLLLLFCFLFFCFVLFLFVFCFFVVVVVCLFFFVVVVVCFFCQTYVQESVRTWVSIAPSPTPAPESIPLCVRSTRHTLNEMQYELRFAAFSCLTLKAFSRVHSMPPYPWKCVFQSTCTLFSLMEFPLA